MHTRMNLHLNVCMCAAAIHTGVQDLEAAKATVAFAERFELLDKKALSNLQLRQVQAGDASGLPR